MKQAEDYRSMGRNMGRYSYCADYLLVPQLLYVYSRKAGSSSTERHFLAVCKEILVGHAKGG